MKIQILLWQKNELGVRPEIYEHSFLGFGLGEMMIMKFSEPLEVWDDSAMERTASLVKLQCDNGKYS